jgi:hypothetical protein
MRSHSGSPDGLSRKVIFYGVVVPILLLVGTAARAADEEPVCRVLLQQIGSALYQLVPASDDVDERAKYLERIALMERSALESAYPSSAGAFDNALADANRSLDAAVTRREVARSAVNMATTAYMQQCPEHFAAMQGNYLALIALAVKSVPDPSQPGLSK